MFFKSEKGTIRYTLFQKNNTKCQLPMLFEWKLSCLFYVGHGFYLQIKL